ncbi:MAG: hypothetical protein AVDCRST_MAG64-144, partial [uncultured Phycisphaerae bacterium]
ELAPPHGRRRRRAPARLPLGRPAQAGEVLV